MMAKEENKYEGRPLRDLMLDYLDKKINFTEFVYYVMHSSIPLEDLRTYQLLLINISEIELGKMTVEDFRKEWDI